jgi:hypothetical protein
LEDGRNSKKTDQPTEEDDPKSRLIKFGIRNAEFGM